MLLMNIDITCGSLAARSKSNKAGGTRKTEGARAQVPVYWQQRPEAAKSALKRCGRPEQQRKHYGAAAKQQQGGRGDGVRLRFFPF